LGKHQYTPDLAAQDSGNALKILEGRWKLRILFNLFDGKVLRFTELERRIAGVSQKVLTQHLRQLEAAGLVHRVVHPTVPPRVDYSLTDWGQALCPTLDGLLTWYADRPQASDAAQADAASTPPPQPGAGCPTAEGGG